jgi:hypothetical protein
MVCTNIFKYEIYEIVSGTPIKLSKALDQQETRKCAKLFRDEQKFYIYLEDTDPKSLKTSRGSYLDPDKFIFVKMFSFYFLTQCLQYG